MSTPAFVLGNGESRKGIKIADMQKHGKVYACNGVYRTETPDYLVAVDPKMVLEISESNYLVNHQVWSNFNAQYNNPKTDGSGFIRNQLQEATKLIKDAGWSLQNGKLVNSKGEPFEFEILLVSPAFERIVLPFIDNLEKLGIKASLRPIDSSQYQKRIESFDFDMIVFTFSQSLSPGNEQKFLGV